MIAKLRWSFTPVFMALVAALFVFPVSERRVAAQAQPVPPITWRVSGSPRIRIVMTDTMLFEYVSGLTMLPEGGLIVASDQRSALLFFDDRGRFVRSIGRRGRGPSEFNGIARAWRFGDTLAVVDLRDVPQIFTLAGAYVRSAPKLPSGRLHGFLGNGDAVVGTLDLDAITPGGWKTVDERLLRIRGSSSTPLGTFASQEVSRSKDGELKGRVFGPRNRVAVFADGFCAGFAGGASIRCFDATATVRASLALSGLTPVAVSDADREAYFNDRYVANQGMPRARLDAMVNAMRSETEFANTMGNFGALVASRDGLLWVGPPSNEDWRPTAPNPLPDRPTRWRIYSRAGVWIANVTLPARFRLFEAGANYVAGVTGDDDGQEVIVVYEVRR
jgi:hypothetical protein